MPLRIGLTIVALTLGLVVLATADAAAALKAPSAISAVALGSSRIAVAWSDSNVGVTGFQVERSLKPTTGFKRIATIGGTVRSFEDDNLAAATTYYYRVRAVVAGRYSRRSPIVNATTFPLTGATPTATRTATFVPTATQTALPTKIATPVPTATRTATPVSTTTATRTATPIPTATPVVAFDPVLIGFLPGIGAAMDVAVVGATAFTASDPFGLSAIDVTAPNAPVVDGTADRPFAGGHTAIGGTRAVVSGVENGLARVWVMDLTAAPRVVGELPTTATAILDVAINRTGTLAVAAMGSSGICVIDLSDPAAPVRRSVFDTAGVAFAVAVNDAGTLAYVADGSGGLKVVSLSNPSAPAQVGALTMSGIQRDVVLAGTIAYLADQSGRLVTVDVTTPGAPAQLGALALGRYTLNVAVDGTRALVHTADSVSYIEVIDVATPASPVALGSVAVDNAGGIKGIALAGGRAYIANGAQGLKIYDLSGTPALQGTMKDAFSATRIAVADRVSVLTGAHAASNTARLQVVDTTDPSAPAVVGELPTTVTAAGILDVAVNQSGTLAVTAMGATGLWVVDLANPTAPARRSVLDTAGVAFAVVLNESGSLAYVADGSGGLKIVSLVSPSAPVQVGSLALSGIQRDIALQGGIAYLADQMGRLVTVDVATPSAPRQLGAVVIGRYTFNVAVDGSQAVVHSADSAAYLDAIDVTTPANPVIEGSVAVDAAGTVKGLALANGRAYVANGAQGVRVYGLADPRAPVLLGGGYTVGDANDVVLGNTRAQAADSAAGLSIIDLFSP
jgi:hypothetical protein